MMSPVCPLLGECECVCVGEVGGGEWCSSPTDSLLLRHTVVKMSCLRGSFIRTKSPAVLRGRWRREEQPEPADSLRSRSI